MNQARTTEKASMPLLILLISSTLAAINIQQAYGLAPTVNNISNCGVNSGISITCKIKVAASGDAVIASLAGLEESRTKTAIYVASVNDNKGDSWSLQSISNWSNSPDCSHGCEDAEIWSAKALSAGDDFVTVTLSGASGWGTQMTMFLFDVSGVSPKAVGSAVGSCPTGCASDNTAQTSTTTSFAPGQSFVIAAMQPGGVFNIGSGGYNPGPGFFAFFFGYGNYGGGEYSTTASSPTDYPWTVSLPYHTNNYAEAGAVFSGVQGPMTGVVVSASPIAVTEYPSQPSAITVTVLDSDGNPVAGQLVSLTTTAGVLSSASGLTNDFGEVTVTLTPNVISSSVITAIVTASAAGLLGDVLVSFLPPGFISPNWRTSSAFRVFSASFDLRQYLWLLPNEESFSAYLITPLSLGSHDLDQFNGAISHYFDIHNCASSGDTNCIQSGYLPFAALILDLPLVPTANALFQANIPTPMIVNLPSSATLFLSATSIETTQTGHLDLAFTISYNTNTQTIASGLGSTLVDQVVAFLKSNPQSLKSTLKDLLMNVLNYGDFTINVITTDLNTDGPLSSYVLFDLPKLEPAISAAFTVAALPGKVLTIGIAGSKALGTGGANLLADGQVILTTADYGIELLPFADPAITSNPNFQLFENVLGVATSFVDPSGSRVIPSFYDSSGTLVLGYNPSDGSIIYSSPSGTIFPAGYGYLALLAENPNSPRGYSEVVNALGAANTLVPYSIQVRSYNLNQAIQEYDGILPTGNSVTIPVQFNPDGSLIPQIHLKPQLTVQQSGTSATIVAKASLSSGDLTSATNAVLVLNGQQYTMVQQDASTFAITLPYQSPVPNVFMVYMVAPNVPGGLALGILQATRTTSTMVTCSPSSVAVNTPTTCTVTVTDTDTNSGTAATPTGTATFSTDNTGTFGPNNSCTLGQVSTSVARCSLTYTPALGHEGTHNIGGSYAGDVDHSGSSAPAPFSLTATKRMTATVFSCAPTSVPVNAPATCTATVSDNDAGTTVAPSGTVGFSTGASGTFGPATCATSGTTTLVCTASYTPSPGSEGTHAITASYAGDTDHSGSSNSANPFTLIATTRPTSTSVSCTPNPLLLNGQGACTMTVTDTSAGTLITPTGTVSVTTTTGGSFSPSTSCTLNQGSTNPVGMASCSLTYTGSSLGPQTITAAYGGDTDHPSSSSDGYTLSVIYHFGGFLPPVKDGGSYHAGRTIPIKFQLTDANGNLVSTAVATITAGPVTGTFSYNGNHYQFNLDTKGMPTGPLTITVSLDDGTSYSITINLS